MSETEQTPRLPDFDTDFLNKVFEYSSNSMNRLSMAGFKALWADRFFGNPDEDKTKVLLDWEFQVALSRNAPVYLTDDAGNPLWIFPPIVGELKSTFTANPYSLVNLNLEIKAIRDRFRAQGIQAQEKMYAGIQAQESNREMINLHLFMIRRECGYLTLEEAADADRLLGVKTTTSPGTLTVDNTDAEDEYDYD